MKKTKNGLLFALALAMMIVLTSCGGNESGTGADAPELTGTAAAAEETGAPEPSMDETEAAEPTEQEELKPEPETESDTGTETETEAEITQPEDVQPQTYEGGVSEQAARIVSEMTVEEKVGQMFLVRNPASGSGSGTEALIRQYQPGGIVMFGVDFKDDTPDGVKAKTTSYQAASALPLLIAADEEGGSVQRVGRYPQYRETPFLSPRAAYASGGLELADAEVVERARLLKSLGLNFNLAPVADVCGDAEAFIYDRSFSGDPGLASEFVGRAVDLTLSEDVACCLKHFPGYGSADDTHTGLATLSRGLDELRSCDLLPFEAGIEHGCPCVMVTHLIVEALDLDNPASVSPAVISLLRDELGFDGVILTDDLAMGGVLDYFGGSEDPEASGKAAVAAVLAGCDMLCCSDVGQIPAVIEAVKNGTVPQELIDAAAGRIVQMKLSIGLMKR